MKYRGYILMRRSNGDVTIYSGDALVDEQPSVEAAQATIDTWMGGPR